MLPLQGVVERPTGTGLKRPKTQQAYLHLRRDDETRVMGWGEIVPSCGFTHWFAQCHDWDREAAGERLSGLD